MGAEAKPGITADLVGVDCMRHDVAARTKNNEEGLQQGVGIPIGRFQRAEGECGNDCDDVGGSEGVQITGWGWARWGFLRSGVS